MGNLRSPRTSPKQKASSAPNNGDIGFKEHTIEQGRTAWEYTIHVHAAQTAPRKQPGRVKPQTQERSHPLHQETKCSKSNYPLPTCYPIITHEVLERPNPTTDEDTIGT